MCGPRARTNFSYDANEPESSSIKFLSATLIAKLQRCHVTSMKMSKRPVISHQGNQEHQQGTSIRGDRVLDGIAQKNTNEMQIMGPLNQKTCESQGESLNMQEFKSLEDDHIDQMIMELLDYGSSIELSSVMQN